MIDPASGFSVVIYRGAIVASLNGWIADVKSRGGVVTQVPSGFWHGIKCGRFGTTAPFTYELPPVWLLVVDGIDTGVYEFKSLLNEQGITEYADNQMQGLVDVVKQGAGLVDFAFSHAITIFLIVVIVVAAVYVLPIVGPAIARGARGLRRVG